MKRDEDKKEHFCCPRLEKKTKKIARVIYTQSKRCKFTRSVHQQHSRTPQ